MAAIVSNPTFLTPDCCTPEQMRLADPFCLRAGRMTGIEIAAVAAFISALKNLKDLTASLGNEVPQQIHDEIFALSERFSSIQVGLLAAQQQAIELTDRCRKLEDELKRVKDWEAEKAGYIRQNVGHAGEIAYKPKSPEPGTDHLLCANCFEDGRKSYLQTHGVKWKCPRCPTSIARRRAAR